MTWQRKQSNTLPRSHVMIPLLIILAEIGCRVPDPPVLKRQPLVILYDTANEPDLRSGKPRRFGLDGAERYVETLAEPVAITEWRDDRCTWEVFVATNRGHLASPDDPTAVNRALDYVDYGRCEVTLPRNDVGLRMENEARKKKSSAGSSDVTTVSASTGAQSVATVEAARLPESEFLAGVSDQVRRSRQQDLLVFVHGFNVTFDAAVTNAAELALKIPFNGAIVTYCWPTKGGVFNYSQDEPINKASVAPFTQFLIALREGVPAETRIHILVHSMGNRIVMESLCNLPEPQGNKPFSHVVLCAPDVGRKDFLNWAPGVVTQCQRVTLYANASDTALIASKGLHSEKRAGDAHGPLIAKGIDTIDCSRIDLSLMGHSYFCNNTDVTTDLFMLLKEDHPPSKRSFLEKKKATDGAYWQFSQHAPTIMCTWHFDED